MTDRGASGFIAGFFYGCDLVGRSLCTGTNSAEIRITLAIVTRLDAKQYEVCPVRCGWQPARIRSW